MIIKENMERPICRTKSICWSAIVGGALVALGLIALFHLLTIGIGLSAATRDEQGMTTIAVGSFIWSFIGSYIMLLLAGWVTGGLAKVHLGSKPCL